MPTAKLWETVAPFLEGQTFDLSMALIGPEKILDSMTLVELCLSLEDLALEEGFDFDWTSEHAMSRSMSIFKSLDSLFAEYNRQKAEKHKREQTPVVLPAALDTTPEVAGE